jgi:hypothetical protein
MVALIYPHEISGRPALTRARELRHPIEKRMPRLKRGDGRRRQEIYNHYSFDTRSAGKYEMRSPDRHTTTYPRYVFVLLVFRR